MKKNDLLIQTQLYWRISNAWNGRIAHRMTITDGIKCLNIVINRTQYKKSLRISAQRLRDEIVIQRVATKTNNIGEPPILLDDWRNRQLSQQDSNIQQVG